MTLDPYKPVPWETFTIVSASHPKPLPLALRVSFYLCVLAMVIGGLIGVGRIYG
jgi:hypothetical protein